MRLLESRGGGRVGSVGGRRRAGVDGFVCGVRGGVGTREVWIWRVMQRGCFCGAPVMLVEVVVGEWQWREAAMLVSRVI